jgi:hypothetical protein
MEKTCGKTKKAKKEKTLKTNYLLLNIIRGISRHS